MRAGESGPQNRFPEGMGVDMGFRVFRQAQPAFHGKTLSSGAAALLTGLVVSKIRAINDATSIHGNHLMLNNIGLPGLFLLLLIVALPVWLIRRSNRKRKDQARIADALEELAGKKSSDDADR